MNPSMLRMQYVTSGMPRPTMFSIRAKWPTSFMRSRNITHRSCSAMVRCGGVPGKELLQLLLIYLIRQHMGAGIECSEQGDGFIQLADDHFRLDVGRSANGQMGRT